jgi:hypothetical protein
MTYEKYLTTKPLMLFLLQHPTTGIHLVQLWQWPAENMFMLKNPAATTLQKTK